MSMIFTRSGWYNDEDNTTYMLSHSKTKSGKTVLSVEVMERPELAPLFIKYNSKHSLPSVAEFLNLLLNISLGQRATTPKYQSHFMDRYDKTFFQDGSKIDISKVEQESVTNLCAFANYIVISRNNKSCGLVESFYDGYRYIVGNLAYTLYHLLHEQEECNFECREYNTDKKSTLVRIDITEKNIKSLRYRIKTLNDAAAFVEGCFLVCFINDHATTDKDKSNAKLRTIVSSITPHLGELAKQHGKQFDVTKTVLHHSQITSVKRAALECIKQVWVISPLDDTIQDYRI